MESLQQSKVYQKEQRRQFKELKELVRRHQKKTSELLHDFNNKYKKTSRQSSKSRWTSWSSHGLIAVSASPSCASGFLLVHVLIRASRSDGDKDDRLQQLREEQQQQLLALRQEQYYSQKYLQREHIKTVTLPQPCFMSEDRLFKCPL